MARYLISYLDGESETVTAANLEPSGSQYIAWVGDGSAAAYIPAVNVRSIVRQDDGQVDD
ncbi:hypothetical protein [Streptomyces sp. H27-D2]|uniref:hypothetical protein n=1 Tax=Streptomyces sp. H27-D2 TaxID=3046304 RepID=UPI002DB98C62|nr:hypothetical protein [Streptomyces sp. H27-D2]MEC4016113.1 hypothetical protein [Streptomyces sp. H27-D2]